MFTSTTSDSPPSHTKVSFKTRSSTQDKIGSNEQGKQSSGVTLKGGDPSMKKKEGEKKKTLILHLKKRSTKELSENVKPSKSEFVGEPSEEKIVKHGSVLKLKKHPPRMDSSPNKSKSRRQNSQRDSKKSGTKKLKYLTSDDDSVSSTEPSTSLDNSESPRKRKPLDGKTPSSSTKKGKKKVKFVDKKHPEVDRILGCRLPMDDMAPCASGGPETSHDISNRSHDGTQSSSNGTAEDVCADESTNHGDENHLHNLEMQKERNSNSHENKEPIKQEQVKKTVSGRSADQTSIIRDDLVVRENVTASINGEDETTSDWPAEKDDTNLPVSGAESKFHGKIEEITVKDYNDVGYEFLIKWVGKSNIHNSWVSESKVKILAKRKLENYKAKYGTSLINICKEQWCQPQRVIALRASLDGVEEALTKWCGLAYDECTWERLDEPTMMKYSHLVTQFKNFECQALDRDVADDYANTRNRLELNVLVDQPKELQGGMLFPHQLEALNWLRKCWYKSKNVILADEMGLGKTVSACAFLSSLCCEFKINLPCLVLVPLSTMPNWMAEFASWAPHLNVVEYHGSARSRSIIRQYEWHAGDASQIGKTKRSYKFNVLLTTYEMVLVDAAYLRSVSWEVLIVDEGHRLKNSSSKLFSLLNSLSFQHRVLLTGTPLQNNIGEMYNLLNFLQPTSFPSLSSFEEKFNDLTTAEKVEELKKLVAPHMLRRLKKDAMQNIPPKTERMVPVELTSIQAEYYRAMLTKNYQVLRNIGKGGAHQSLLNIVMQLRKVCNHPYLIPGTEPESGTPEFLHEMRIKASAKLTLLHSMLKILHKDGHRVLIFSQMTKLLDILEDYLTLEFGPKTFERVDGSVSVAERQAAIARFNQDKTRFVFLLSTRSCGLGINLATADTVIIYDSDFNPHADIQAMNRAHRIGQSNRLLVYRLVVRASVEERILQLAKKKLMLDQLFVNKSESQKEVEDIIRWGTEELFRNSDNADGKDSNEASGAVADVEFKHRRRTGGLGDVYEDKCIDGSAKLVWDENAIMKLLDRSNLPSTVAESTDGDLDNDMLGTVKSIDWNDELNDDPGTNEDIPSADNDGCEQASESKQGAATRAEENEWDKLLRVRWEQYQIEEEASLGRGKRLRKAVSYRETFAALPNEALSEDSDEGDEPKREYTAAGLALKEKYGRLRARQKERIAQRHIIKNYADDKLEEFMTPYDSIANEHAENPLIIVEDPNSSQLSGAKRFRESTAEMRPSSKKSKRYAEIPQDVYARILGNTASSKHHSKGADVFNPGTPNHLLPVLGLCAPNADQIPPISGKGVDPVENSGPSIASFQGKLGLPNFGLDDNIPLKHMKSIPDMLPNLSLGAQKDCIRNSVPELPDSSLLPNFMADIAGTSKQKSFMSGLLPGLGLSPVQPIHSAMPDNHKKVLDNIMMRAQYASNKFLKKRSKLDYWSEDELDALWIGVRRHGRGNWDAMLRDPKLKFLNNRTSEELASRWILEEQKIIEEPMSIATRHPSSAPFPGISDAMMSRALNESNFSKLRMEQPKLQSHLTDIQLGSSDILSRLPHVEAANYMNSSEGGPSQIPWQDFKHRSGYGGDFRGSTFDKLEKPDIGLIPSFMPNPFMNDSIGSLPINRKNNSTILQSEIGPSSCENILLHGVSDGQIHLLHEMQRRVRLGKQPMEMNFNRTDHSNPQLDNSSDLGGSKSNKLPHWLQEAVRAPSSKPPERELPATVSAIAQSACLLLGEQELAIPPFLIPGTPLSRPKDPRINSKKRKLRRVQQSTSHVEHSKTGSGQGDHDTTPTPPSIEALPPTVDCNDGAPSLNLNSLSSSSASSQGKEEVPVPPPTFEESHPTVEGSEAIEATCTSKSEAPEISCQITGSSLVDDKASGCHGSPIKDTPDTGARLPESDNSAPAAPELPVVGDAPGTSASSGAADTPVPSDDNDLKQNNPLDNAGSTMNLEEPMEKPTPLEETRDSDESHPVPAQIADEDRVDKITSDEH
ncbi:Protein CHROMATIN REMODELING 4 [Dichanthelium oligosanthes]|uniref:Protein CHROMATIN REMODELING 4 n=1 Tax=Dichanthelium oligosanthes TaxID=888268 RepID=A0A1E5WB89_9POAL|nr:Protein CHROMATIN REMODELING 4 [Dichanthelium oligosanthes]